MAKTLLIVEDDAVQRELLCTLLEAHGYACIGVEDGQRARGAARTRTPLAPEPGPAAGALPLSKRRA